MTGSVSTKVARLVSHLARNPRYLPRYLSHNFARRKLPLDLGIPWFSYAAIDFLDRFVKPEMTVFEYGSGGSTLFFARRAKHVTCVEDDPAWIRMVRDRLDADNLSNTTILAHPYDFTDASQFRDSAYLHALGTERYDIIVVDGHEEWDQVRPTCFIHAEPRVKPGGVIVVDDSWRYPGLRTTTHAKRVQRFESVGPGRPGVTSTDVHYY